MNKYTRLFIEETRSYIATITDEIKGLRETGSDPSRLIDCCRLAHSIKGMARFEEQVPMASLAYALERGFEALSLDLPRHNGIVSHVEKGLEMLLDMVEEVNRNGTSASDPSVVIGAIREQLES